MYRIRSSLAVTAIAIITWMGAGPGAVQDKPAIKEIEALAGEAYLYRFPIIVGYKALYEFFIDQGSGQFKAPINEINNEARVFTPKDTAISTPSSDTPYPMALLDLRAEPFVLSCRRSRRPTTTTCSLWTSTPTTTANLELKSVA